MEEIPDFSVVETVPRRVHLSGENQLFVFLGELGPILFGDWEAWTSGGTFRYALVFAGASGSSTAIWIDAGIEITPFTEVM